MTPAISFRFELLFLLGVLLSLIAIFAAVVLLLRKRPARAWRLLARLSVIWAIYLSIVLLFAAATPRQIIPTNHDLCFDELCFAVVNLRTTEQVGTVNAKGVFYIVTVRASNRANGRAQSERGLRAQLWSGDDRYEVSQSGQMAWEATHRPSAQLTTRLNPGQSILSDQVFDIPQRANDVGIVLTHGFTPGYFVIGECPLFHRPTILQVPQ